MAFNIAGSNAGLFQCVIDPITPELIHALNSRAFANMY